MDLADLADSSISAHKLEYSQDIDFTDRIHGFSRNSMQYQPTE